MLCTRSEICFAKGIVSRYQSNPRQGHWTAVKHILKYLRGARDYMLAYKAVNLVPVGYTDFYFQSDRDNNKSTSGFCVYFRRKSHNYGRVISIGVFLDSTIEAEYMASL